MSLKFKKGIIERYEKRISKNGKQYNLPIYSGQGYYFNEGFLSRYEHEAINILRNRALNMPEEKRNKSLEWKEVGEYMGKINKQIRKTRKKKKQYYQKLAIQSRKNKIKRLKEELKRIQDES